MNPNYQKLIIDWHCKKLEEEIYQTHSNENRMESSEKISLHMDRTAQFMNWMISTWSSLNSKIAPLIPKRLLLHKSR